MYGNEPYAILQMAPLGRYQAQDRDNASYLMDELKLLTLGQYFADSFWARAIAHGVDLADIAGGSGFSD